MLYYQTNIICKILGVDISGVDILGVDISRVDISGVDILGVDILGVDILGKTQMTLAISSECAQEVINM